MKVTLATLALVAGLVCVQAAGGIKGRQQAEDSQFRFQAVKGPAALRPTFAQPQPQPQPQQQQQYAVQQQQTFAAPQPAIKAPVAVAGPGQIAPVFSAVRVQPAAPLPAPAPAPLPLAPVQQVPVQVQEQEPESQQVQQQQQAPDQEVDPSAAAQEGNPALLAPARPAAAAAASEEEANPRPEPYNFQYAFNAGDAATSGSSTREEQQDASGRVTGFYTLKGEDGRDRRVDYVADASGFRATISTNELGTANKDSADVDWNAQGPSEAQLRAAESATQAARQRALQSPAQNQLAQQQQFSSSSSSSNQQPQQAATAFSASSSGPAGQQKFSSPRQRGPAAAAAAAASQQTSRASFQPQQVQLTAQQLQEPFEQIRQTELLGRARKSRHAPFYLFTV